MSNKIDNLQALIKNSFVDAKMDKYYEHTVRVVGYTKVIIENEVFDREKIIAAAWIHDIGRICDNSFIGHIKELRNVASSILECAGFSNNKINQIIDIAEKHHPPIDKLITDPEAQVIYDADNLELTGAIGLLRWYDTFPEKTESLISSSKMFLDIYNSSIKMKGSFFYTNKACEIGESRIIDNIEFCKKMIMEVESIVSREDYNLATCKLYPNIKIGKSVEKKQKIIALAGFRCAGKSYLIDLIKERFNKIVDLYSTNRVKTGDSDADSIGPMEIIRRYGNNQSYLWFLKDDIISFCNVAKDIVIIDSIKTDKDVDVLKVLLPDAEIYTLWIQTNYNVRLERYIKRDVITEKRCMSLDEHDNQLIELGILNIMRNANGYILTNVDRDTQLHMFGAFLVSIT